MTRSFENIDHVYLIGIGGIGMSALARYFRHIGKSVAGYDRIETQMTQNLKAEGISVTTQNTVETIPQEVKNAAVDNVLVIYTAAIRDRHEQLDWLREKGHSPVKRAEVLGEIANSYQLIAVGGTHGKTTTSCLIAHLLSRSDIPFMAILGGMSTDLGSNFYVNSENPRFMVTEADEFDGSFHHLSPHVTVLTSTDADHLDFYGTEENIRKAFLKFGASTQTDGMLLYQVNAGIDPEKVPARAVSYGIGEGDTHATNMTIQDNFYFDYNGIKENLPKLYLGVPGAHNVENAVAAIGAVLAVGMPAEKIPDALASFKGVKRRFEYIVRRDDLVFIDDYAHHPTELRSTIHSVKELYPGKKITGIFQPHLYSRTRDFAASFANSLSELDVAILMPIYPAREKPIPGVDTEMIRRQMDQSNSRILDREQVIEFVRKERPEVLLTLGAGDIDLIVEPLKSVLS